MSQNVIIFILTLAVVGLGVAWCSYMVHLVMRQDHIVPVIGLLGLALGAPSAVAYFAVGLLW